MQTGCDIDVTVNILLKIKRQCDMAIPEMLIKSVFLIKNTSVIYYLL